MAHNRRGASMIYVIAALLVTGFVGTSLINMSHSDRMVSVLYSGSQSARLAAHSGIVSATAFLGSSNSDTISDVLDMINGYVAARNPDTLSDEFLWIRGGADSWESISATQHFKVRIAALQPATFGVTLVSEGKGSGGSRATSVGVYDLSGLEYAIVSGSTPIHALQMDNGAFEFDVPLIVNGNTSIRKGMALWDPAVFHGTLRCDTLVKSDGSKEIGAITFSSGQLEVDGAAYFAGEIGGGGANAKFNSSAGFDGKFYFQNSKVQFDATGSSRYVFDGGTDDAGTGDMFDLQNNEIEVYDDSKLYEPVDNMDAFFNMNNPSWSSISNSSVDVAARVGFPTEPPPKIYFDTAALTVIHATIDAASNNGNGPGLTGESLNAIYAASSGSRINGFAVARVINTNTASGIFVNDGSVFTGKLILWVDDARNIVQDYVETSASANLSMYVKDGAGTTPHFNNFNYARGYIYLNDYNTADNFAFGGNGGNCEIAGGIYANENTQLFFHGSGVQTITYDSDVITELAGTGVFNNPDGSSGSSSFAEIKLQDGVSRISLDLLGDAL
jgi:hypothetical protein